MRRPGRSVKHDQRRPAAAVLVVLSWVFWLFHWGPALLVVTFVAWLILHKRLEAGLGDILRRQWRRVWPPAPPVLIALLAASALAFVLADAPATTKVVPIGLNVLASAVILFGHSWRLFTTPRWLGGPTPSGLRTSPAMGTDALTIKGERT